MWHLEDTEQTGSMKNSNIQPTVCLKSRFNALCLCIYILWVSPKHVFHPLLPFSPKLEFYKVIFLTAGDLKNYLAVHKGWPLKWKLVTSNTKECNRITINRNDSKRKGFFRTNNLCVLRLLCECRFSACLVSLWKKGKHSKSWKNKTMLCAISMKLLVAFFLTSMKHILNKQFTFSGGHTVFSQTHFIPSQPF